MPEKGRLLLVDDDAAIRQALGVRLRAVGYEVTSADDGESGLAAAIESRPDLIILDIRMPVMDGLTMLTKLRECDETREIPAIVLSANVAEKTRTEALNRGARYFIEKPYDAVKLVQAVKAALDFSAASDLKTKTTEGVVHHGTP